MFDSPHSFINILGKDYPWYGILFLVGLVVGGIASTIRSRKKDIDRYDSIYCAVFAAMGGIVGAKMFSMMMSVDVIVLVYQKLPFLDATMLVMQNGFVFYGGLIGGFIGIIIYCTVYKLSYTDFLDIFAVSVPLGHVFGRIGCFMSGCCYGIPHDGFFSVIYLEGITADVNAVGPQRLAVQLIEAISLFVLYIILETVYYKTKKKGLPVCLYIIGYSIIRFTLEYFRGDPARGFLLGMTTSQLISVLLVSTMLFVLGYNHVKNKYEKGRVGYTSGLSSVVAGAIGLLFSLLLLALSTSKMVFGELGTNTTYCVMLISLLSITLTKGINVVKSCVRLKKQGGKPDKDVYMFGFMGTVLSTIGMVLTLVSVGLIISVIAAV